MTKYGRQAGKFVEKGIREYKHEHRWKNPKQAVAVGLHKAREHGVKVPKKK